MGTAIANIVRHDEDLGARAIKLSYAIALLFGLIHGLAFASNFKVMMFGEYSLTPFLVQLRHRGRASLHCDSIHGSLVAFTTSS